MDAGPVLAGLYKGKNYFRQWIATIIYLKIALAVKYAAKYVLLKI
jgi:hypothetical protein